MSKNVLVTGSSHGIGAAVAVAFAEKGYNVGITYCKTPDGAVKTLCAEHFPGIYALGETAACPRKPAADMVFKAMKDIGVDRCIYVGDSDVDVITAQNTGAPCLSVLWGFRNEDDIRQAGGKYFCHDPKDLAQTLKQMVSKIYGQ